MPPPDDSERAEPPAEPAEPALAELPAAVQDRVLALAARGLGALATQDIPPRLRPFARFTPQRRARLAAGMLADAVVEPGFRQRIGTALTSAGGPAPAVGVPADPDSLARLWLIRPPGWAAAPGFAHAADAHADAHAAAGGPAPGVPATRGLADALAAARAAARQERVQARRELSSLRTEIRSARAATEAATRDARTARAEAAAARAVADAEAEQARAAIRESEAAVRRLRRRVEELTAELALARRDTRASREAADTRLGLLLQTLGGAVAGLGRELGLPTAAATTSVAPADTVDAREPAPPSELDARAESWDSPGTLARFLALPKAHLLVDGYNVTKAALPTLPLARQRELLLRNLAGLAAQTGAEVTVVFDGADVTAVPAAGVAGVRVRFSPVGVTADEVLRAMARAEPRGRPVVVVSSDREVAEGVRRAGATAVGSGVLVRRLLGG